METLPEVTLLAQYSTELTFAMYLAITIGVTEVLKRAFKILKRFIPLVALIVGLALAFTQGFTIPNLLIGLIIGLTSSGSYSSVKHLVGR